MAFMGFWGTGVEPGTQYTEKVSCTVWKMMIQGSNGIVAQLDCSPWGVWVGCYRSDQIGARLNDCSMKKYLVLNIAFSRGDLSHERTA